MRSIAVSAALLSFLALSAGAAEARNWQGPAPASGVRASVGLGIGNLGPGIRAGLDSSFWVAPWIAPTLRVNWGRDGIVGGGNFRHLIQAEPGVLFRVASGPGGSLMVGAGVGYAWVRNVERCGPAGCTPVFENSHQILFSGSIGTVAAPRRAPGLALSAIFRVEVMHRAGLVPTINFGIGPRIRLANEI